MTDLNPQKIISLATAQRSLGDPSLTFPLFPPLVEGCPRTSTPDLQYPLVIDDDYKKAAAGFFERQSYARIWR